MSLLNPPKALLNKLKQYGKSPPEYRVKAITKIDLSESAVIWGLRAQGKILATSARMAEMNEKAARDCRDDKRLPPQRKMTRRESPNKFIATIARMAKPERSISVVVSRHTLPR